LNLSLLFGSAFVVALSGALMPGPLLAVTLGHSPRYGWTFGPLAILGHGILELGLISVIFLGAGPILKSHGVQAVVGLAGGTILIWMGWGMFSVARSSGDHERSTGISAPGYRPVLLGIVTSVSNPYWTIWWATVGLAYLMVAAKSGPVGIAVFFLGHISGDLAWYTLVSWGAARGMRFTGTRIYSFVLFMCSVVLVVLGAWFVWYGVRLIVI
jgi:threonine/homoserine/homoserine lactone efflux protein